MCETQSSRCALNAIVLQNREVAPGLIVLRVAPDAWQFPSFVPGQYAVLALPGAARRCPDAEEEDAPVPPDRLIKRAYSIASSSRTSEYLEFYISLVRSGSLTPRLVALEIGDRIWVGAKFTGTFTFESVPDACQVAMLATGTGLAPYVSMMRSSLAHNSRRWFTVIHGARHSWELGYAAEMHSLQRLYPKFTYLPVVSRAREEPVPWQGLVGHCQDLWRRRVLDEIWNCRVTPDNTHVFLCGNPAMIEGMIELLETEGFREHTRKCPGQIHTEKYW